MNKSDIIFCKSGGCTAKLGAGLLSHVLEKLPKGEADPRLLVGYDSHDDAAVYQVSEDLAIVQTLDFFPPMVEDPYLFGKIAATNALSDIYAMGGDVKTALNIVCFPESMDLNILGKIMQGGSEKVMEAGGSLAGGHSIADTDIKYGLSVMGTVHPKEIWTNTGARPGDALVFTKGLGTGIICAAKRAGEVAEDSLEAAIASMTLLNRKASEIARNYTIHACTDVTGFGFLGHLHEMMHDEISCQIHFEQVPVLGNALQYASEFLITGGGQKNRNYAERYITFDGVNYAAEEVLFDPQTAGGLLFALPEEEAPDLISALHSDYPLASIVGKVLEKQEIEIRVTK